MSGTNRRYGSQAAKCAGIVAVLLALAGCEQTFRNMYDQAKYKPLAPSAMWADGRSSRPAVDGSVSHAAGTFAGSSSGRLALTTPAPVVPPIASVRDDLRPQGADVGTLRMPPITLALLQRGQERFDIYCAPCHSVAGDGDGFIARRGFPHPPSYHTDALRAAGDAHFYAVITDGYGAMYSYASRLTPEDRMAVVAYIRALQLSQHASLDDVPPDQRAALEARR
jgi:mono/diheme cytochrome c family protein